MDEAVIFPAQPLFMIDRSWQRNRKWQKEQSQHHAVHNSPYRVPEVTIIPAKGSADIDVMTNQEQGLRPSVNRKPNLSAERPFIMYEPPKADSRTGLVRDKRHTAASMNTKGTRKGKHAKRRTSNPDDLRVTSNMTASTALTRHVPGTASPLYAAIDPEVGAFQGFISYYSTRIAVALFPISKYIPLQYNPIQTIWLPAAVADEALLHTILFSSAQHYSAACDRRTFKDSEVLTKIILASLNRRLSAGTLSDVTIGAVSCLALSENLLGNHDKCAMHIAGMSGMISARGGVSTIQEAMRMKIYRADMIGAFDTLSEPRLPRPPRTSPPLYRVLELGAHENMSLASILTELQLTPALVNAFMDLSYLCQALDQAAKKHIPLDPKAYDEDIICIQHDMLLYSTSGQRDPEKVCRLAGLIFVQSLTRERPFSKASSTLPSRELRVCLTNINPDSLPDTLLFWVHFMGGLVSAATEDKEWYLLRLGKYKTSGSKPVTWNEARNHLKQIMWIDTVLEERGKKLWSQVHPIVPLLDG